ncbi:MAG: hypothetical protein DRI34_04065 [Deltaproteobacteria bacterium]|nr:MAG: hypothetical protein DRI34_04065 [Deltaproteobacteria bacterium]
MTRWLAVAVFLLAACTPEKTPPVDAGRKKAAPATSKQAPKNLFAGWTAVELGKHLKGVTHVGYSPDGKLLVSCDRAGVVKLWRGDNHTLWRELKGHGAAVMMAAFSPDGKLLATVSRDETARLWDVGQGKLVRVLKDKPPREKDMSEEELARYAATPKPAMNWAAFSADGKRLATAGDDFALKIWDVASGRKLATIEDFGCHQRRVLRRPDGPGWLSSAGCADDGVSYLKFWDEQGNLVNQGGDAQHDAHFVALDPAGRFIVAADGSLALTTFSMQGSQLRRLLLPGYHFCVTFGQRGRYLAVGAEAGKIWVLEVETWKRVGTIDCGHKAAVDSLAVSPSSGVLAAGLRDGRVVYFDRPFE